MRQIIDELLIKHDDRFRVQTTILSGSESQYVNTYSPGHLRWRAAERHQRICEPRAVHMQPQRGVARCLTDRLQFVKFVHSAILASLCDRNCGRLDLLALARSR